MDPAEEAKALADYAAAGIKLHAAGAITSPKTKMPISAASSSTASAREFRRDRRRRSHPAILPRMEKFVKEYDIRIAIHNHGPEDKLWPSPLDVLKAVKNMDPRMGCCIDVGHAVRAGTDVVQAIHDVGPRLFNMHMKDLTNFQTRRAKSPWATASCRYEGSSRPSSRPSTRDLSISNMKFMATIRCPV